MQHDLQYVGKEIDQGGKSACCLVGGFWVIFIFLYVFQTLYRSMCCFHNTGRKKPLELGV